MFTAYLKKWFYFILYKLRMLGLCFRAAKNAYRKAYEILNKH